MRTRPSLLALALVAACAPGARETVDSSTAAAAVSAPAANVKADEDSIRAINKRWQDARRAPR